MGNNNSTPAKEAIDAPVSDPQLPIKRYHSIQVGARDANSTADAQASSGARPTVDKFGAPKLGRAGSIFGRTSSHDGAVTPQRIRSRSGSVSGFFSQRRGSTALSAASNAPALAATTESGAMKSDVTPTREDYSHKVAAGGSNKKQLDVSDYDVSSPNGTGIETAIRSTPRTRRVTDGLGTFTPPASAFDPRTFVPPQPSPSVAMHAHYAAGLSSHHSGKNVPSEAASSSSTRAEAETKTSTEQSTEGRNPPSLVSRSSNRHPLFGIEDGNNGLYANAGNSTGNSAAASPSLGGSSPVLSPQTFGPHETESGRDSQARPLAALPSYLKIPTAIPSAHVDPASPSTNLYPHLSDQPSSLANAAKDDDSRPTHLVGGSGAATAIVDAVDVVISPGNASKASSPVGSRKASISSAEDGSKISYSEHNADAARAAGIDVTDFPVSSPNSVPGMDKASLGESVPRSLQQSSDGSVAANASGASRTPTPTPSAHETRSLTPTDKESMRLRSLSPAKAPATSMGAPSGPVSTRRPHMDVQTGGNESGFNTPLLPPGLTSAPPSASVPGETPLAESLALTPTGERRSSYSSKRNNAASSAQPTTPSSANQQILQQQQQQNQGQSTLMPIVLTWRAGGREVFVTGTFANEWRSKILLHKSKRDHTCVLHLPPGTHRLKFIVDDRWRVSRELPTATDGDGNLVNYVEIPNVGPAHPGPLSAPGEDFTENTANTRVDRNSKIESKKTTMNLVEEARRAEAAQLEDFFDEDGKDHEEAWTNEIPASLIEAQEAEEAIREALESNHEKHQDSQHSLPNPPALPRQLEKVILNSSPANPNNGGTTGSTVDDNSILPAPNHVVLNHLTASSIKGGVLAVGTTTRYKRKYVTTVYYRPVQV